MTSYRDLELRSEVFLDPRAFYNFGSTLQRLAPVSEFIRQGVDCAQGMAWLYGPWRPDVPDWTGAIDRWSTGLGLQIALPDRKPGDLVWRRPGDFGEAIGHVGMVLEDITMIRQARDTRDGCGDWPVTASHWTGAIRMDIAVDVPPPVDLGAVAKAMAAARAQVVAHPLALMSTGLAVSIVQEKLAVARTDVYDYATVAAVAAYQAFWNGHRRTTMNDQPLLAVDGVVGKMTWGCLFGEYP